RSRSPRAQVAQPDSTARRSSARRRRERGGRRRTARENAAYAPGQRTKSRSSSDRRVGRRASGPINVRTALALVPHHVVHPGLLDRSSAPRARPTRLAPDRLHAIAALRRLRMTAAEIAECLSMALSTVSRWLRRIELGKLSRLDPPEPANRYERKRAGELVHL